MSFHQKLSRLRPAQVGKILGPKAPRLLALGGIEEIDIGVDVEFSGDVLRLRLGGGIVATLLHDPQAPEGIRPLCSHCKGPCEHVGAALSLVLEEKAALGLATAAPKTKPTVTPTLEELESRELARRAERAEREPLKVRSLDPDEIWSDHLHWSEGSRQIRPAASFSRAMQVPLASTCRPPTPWSTSTCPGIRPYWNSASPAPTAWAKNDPSTSTCWSRKRPWRKACCRRWATSGAWHRRKPALARACPRSGTVRCRTGQATARTADDGGATAGFRLRVRGAACRPRWLPGSCDGRCHSRNLSDCLVANEDGSQELRLRLPDPSSFDALVRSLALLATGLAGPILPPR